MRPTRLASCLLQLAFIYCSELFVAELPRGATSARASLRGGLLDVNLPVTTLTTSHDIAISNHRRAQLAEVSAAATAAAAAAAERRAAPRPSPSKPPRRRSSPSPPPPTPSSQPPSPNPPSPITASPTTVIAKPSDKTITTITTAESLPVSRVCGVVTLVSPIDKSTGAPKYTFGRPVSCDGMAAWMAQNLTDAAARAGAQISVPFTLEGCTAVYNPAARPALVPTLTVCGAFSNVKEAAKIQGAVQRIIAQWRFLVMGLALPPSSLDLADDDSQMPYFCPPPGYDIVAVVYGDEDESPMGYLKVNCSH